MNNAQSDEKNLSNHVSNAALGGLDQCRQHWWLLFVLGALLIIGGVIAISYPFVSGVGTVMLLAALLIIGGIATVIGAFWAGKWSAFLLQLLIGLLYIMVGFVVRDTPLESTALLTLFIAAIFVVMGVFRIVVALVQRFPQWGWTMLNGVVTLAAGVIIYDTFPMSALWLVGLLIGLDLLFNGMTWIMLALTLRRIGAEANASEGDA